ncbi:YkgJ family cysteine cluster protein [Desulforegula conservatrix]|uniref:YkgJ family cysteine cluster protein n=1 Tax=Desulforegula conservatrix TaxID=153026 RepID=UPI0004202DB4|nr:YkgJ family cysteine cluster protein [Desulforegula conservatrix]
MTTNSNVKDFLLNYKNLVKKIDEKCLSISTHYNQHIKCKKGCSQCCKLDAVFPVEAVSIALSVIDNKIGFNATRENEDCNFLKEGICTIYNERPIICRTHGYPIFFEEDGRQKADCCSMNFSDIDETLGSNAFVDIDKINNLLYTINSLFIKELNLPFTPDERVLLTDIEKFI